MPEMPEKPKGGQDNTPAQDTSSEQQPSDLQAGPDVPRQKLDQTIPGGKFLKDGNLVNANGERIDETGRVLKLQ